MLLLLQDRRSYLEAKEPGCKQQ